MDTTFELLGLTVHAYGLCATIAALVVMAGVAGSKKLPKGTAGMFTLLGVVLGVVGARLVFCLGNITTFTEMYENPWLMLCFFDGGLSMPGLFAGLIAAAALTARLMKIRMADVLDAAAMPAGVAVAILRFGEQFTDLGVGKAVKEGFATANLPWLFSMSRMGVAVEYRLNVWAYEAAAGMVIFAVMLLLARRLKNSGDKALLFAALFGASQIIFESMRDDGHMLIIFLRIGQLGAAAVLIAASVILTKRAGKWCRIAMWIDTPACVLGIILLEFSLDGRLTFGNPTLLRDYTLMAILCANMLLYPCLLLLQRNKA